MPQTFVLPRQVALDDDANPMAGALAYFYQTGTTTPQAVYADIGLTTPHTNPLVADSSGRFPKAYYDPAASANYRVRVTTASGVQVYQEDDIDRFTVSQAEIAAALYPTTTAEDAADATIVNQAYPPGHVYRYGTNTTPGTTDMTVAINTAADVCRQGGYTLLLPPEKCLVSSSLDFDLIRVQGPTADMAATIQATSAQFHVILIRQSASCANFRVDGAWDGSTAGQTGDIFHIANDGGTGFAYNIHLENITATNAKQRLIYIEKGGYTSIWNFHGLGAGLHGLEIFGTSVGGAYSTTVTVGGQSTFGACPNGYGLRLTNCVACSFRDVIMEDTHGIVIEGNDNRALSFDNVYQENFSVDIGGTFIDFSDSGGIGLSITNCFGGNKGMTAPTNWQNIYYASNTNLGESYIPYAGRLVQGIGAEATTTTTGGVSVTAASVSIPPGTWEIEAVLQTAVASGTPALSDAGIMITTNVADSGANSSTSTLIEGADRTAFTIANSTVRLRAWRTYQNTTTSDVTMYLRAFFNISAGTLAYASLIVARKM